VRPLMSQYVTRLLNCLEDRGFAGSFLMMLSDGALTTVDQASRFPIRLVEGGPAGGVALAAHVARDVGSSKTLSLDIGGTTAKICFIEKGSPKTNRHFEVARAWRDIKGSGLPVKVPTVELVEIGAGGGSIAKVDKLGRLRVGPTSAGSEPGPASYSRGGTSPTVTDAHLLIKNISANGFADGLFKLDVALAHEVISNQLQLPLEMDSAEQTAAGVVELADETMANAARIHGVELGLDVSEFDLLVSGGGGGLHGARIAEKLGIGRVIIPENAGVGSAIGFLRSVAAFESAISVVETMDAIDASDLSKRIENTKAYVRNIVEEIVEPKHVSCNAVAELRYQGQGLEVALPLAGHDGLDLDDLVRRFEQRYREIVGFTLPQIPIELISISVRAFEVREKSVTKVAEQSKRQTDECYREVYDQHSNEFLTHRVVERRDLGTQCLHGPLIITEPQTSTLVKSGWKVQQSISGHLVLERKAS
ncbi:MAG: hydantoinase/oxoprolinase family protein, partial [Alphaproteobacteria bacterium]